VCREITLEQIALRAGIENENAAFTKGLRVLDGICQRRVTRPNRRRKAAPDRVNKIARCDRVTIGESAVMPQMKHNLGPIFVDLPTFSQRRNRLTALRII